jgi:hypothetical protein
MTSTSSDSIELKSFGALEIKDVEQGEVCAIVCTLGIVDKDGDVLLPGSFPPSASVKMSGYGHDVIVDGSPPVGKGTIKVEGDKAIFTGKFFMSSDRAREAFNIVKELGADGDWSFGFPRNVKTEKMTDEWKSKGAKRLISAIMPIEASPVFEGAGHGTGTLYTKAKEGEPDPTIEAAEPKPKEKEAPDVALEARIERVKSSIRR